MMADSQDRYPKGMDVLEEFAGKSARNSLEELGRFAPELSRFAVESFGDLYGDHTIDAKTRELATVAALTVLGHALPQLRVHVRAALNVGATPAEVIAIVTQMYAYGGFPAALNAMREVRSIIQAESTLANTEL